MIENNEQLKQRFDQLARMYAVLSDLRSRVEPANPGLFAVLAEAPLDEIHKIREEIDAFTGASAALEQQPDMWLRVEGEAIEIESAPTSVMTALLDALRKGVQATAEYLGTGELAARPTALLKQACDFEIAALAAGSLRIGLRLPVVASGRAKSESELARRALTKFLDVAAWAGTNEEHDADEPGAALDDPRLRRVILNSLKQFVPRPRGRVERIELSGRALAARAPIALTRASHIRIDREIDRIVHETTESHAGWLREVDLDDLTFTLRNVDEVNEIHCTFDDDLAEAVKAALDRRIRVTGHRRTTGARRRKVELRVVRLELAEEPEDGEP